MKTVLILFLSIWLHASCTPEAIERSNDYFAQANQEREVAQQIRLLEQSLQSCFAYEVAFYLLKLQAQEEPSVEKKSMLYNQALETLSHIKHRDAQVIEEQNQINRILSHLYRPIDPKTADIYQKKVRPTAPPTTEGFLQTYGIYLLGLVVLMWILLPLIRPNGKKV